MQYNGEELDPKARRARLIGLVVLIAAFAVIGALALLESLPQGNVKATTTVIQQNDTTTVNTTTVAYTTTSTAVSTTAVTTSILMPPQVIAGLANLTSKENALYRIPNSSLYTASWHIIYAGGPNFYAYFANTSTYGLGFLQPYISGEQSYSNLSIPSEFANITAPAGVEISALLGNSNALLNNGTLSGFLFPINASYNQTLQQNGRNHTTYYTQSSFLLNGMLVGSTTVSPYANALYYHKLDFMYKNAVVAIIVYGIPGAYNDNYTYTIARHLVGILKSQQWVGYAP